MTAQPTEPVSTSARQSAPAAVGLRAWRREGLTPWRVFALTAICLGIAGWLWPAAGTVDDAYIQFRCADHLIHNGSLKYNKGDRVEVYASLAQVVLLAPATLISPAAPAKWAAALGVLAWAWVTALVWRRIRRERGPRQADLPDWLALFSLMLCAPAVIWAWSGKETTLFTLTCVAAWLAHHDAEERNRPPWASGLLTFAAVLVRPEGVLLGAVLGLAWLWPCTKERRQRFQVYAVSAGGLVGLYWIVRGNAFHRFWPNPFWTKFGGGLAPLDGLNYLLGSLCAWLLPFVLIYLLARQFSTRRSWPRWLKTALAFAALSLLYAFVIGGDKYGYQRFLLPAYPFVALAIWRLWTDRRVAADEAAPDGFRLPFWNRPGHYPYPWLWGLSAAVLLAAWAVVIPPGDRTRHREHLRLMERFTAAGRACRDAVPPKAMVVTFASGAFGYYCGHHLLDLSARTDKHLATVWMPAAARRITRDRWDYDFVYGHLPPVVVQWPNLYANDLEGERAWLRDTMARPQQYAAYDSADLKTSYQLCWLPVPLTSDREGMYAFVRTNQFKKRGFSDWKCLKGERAALPFEAYRELLARSPDAQAVSSANTIEASPPPGDPVRIF